MKRFVVTGCAGFVGSHLAEALLARGDGVVGVDSFSDYYARADKEDNVAAARAESAFSLVVGDLTALDLEELVAAADGVFHLAAQPGVRGSWGDSFAAYLKDNVHATQRVLEAALRAGVRVVFASSSSVYGDAPAYPTREDAPLAPISPYGVTKLACEALASAYAPRGLDAVTLRFFAVYGPRQRPDMAFARLLSALTRGVPFHVFGSGGATRDFTYVGDAVTAALAAMDLGRAGAVYNVGGGTEVSLRDAITTLGRVAGEDVEVVYGEPVPGDAVRTAADTARIRAELCWAPRTALDAGLRQQLEWVRARGG